MQYPWLLLCSYTAGYSNRIHSGRSVVYSATFPGILEGDFRGCSGLFRGDFGEVSGGKMKENIREKRGKLYRTNPEKSENSY